MALSVRCPDSSTLQAKGTEFYDLDSLQAVDIILVDPDSSNGCLLIQKFKNDASLAVLNVQWAEKSLRAGRPLLAGDSWGGCLPKFSSEKSQQSRRFAPLACDGTDNDRNS